MPERFELKFVLHAREAQRLEEDLQRWVVPDPVTGRDRYRVTSLYYDTPDLRCYWEKLDGIKRRRKVRIRRYADGAVFVEIKSRDDRVTSKERVRLSLAEAVALCDSGVLPDVADLTARSTVVAVQSLVQLGPMRPTALTDYQRTAYRGSECDPGLRITFDRALRCSVTHLDLTSEGRLRDMLPPDRVVLEAKVPARLPKWFAGLVAAHALQLTRVSKYALAVERGELVPTRSIHHPHPQRIAS